MKFGHRYVKMEEQHGDGGAGGAGGGEDNSGAGGNNGGSDGKWYDSLPQEMREDQNITKFDSMEAMAKSWQNAQRLIGADKIPMPTTDDDWSNVYNRLGRPEEASKYDIKAVEGFEVNQEQQDAFKTFAHSVGLSQNQVQQIASWDMERSASASTAIQEASKTALESAHASLKAEWGEATGQNTNIAAKAAAEFMGEDGKDFFENTIIDGVPAGEHPGLLKMFHAVGKGMLESNKLEGIANEGKKTPQEIQDDINSTMANPAYTDKRHPEHKSVMLKAQNLFKLQAG